MVHLLEYLLRFGIVNLGRVFILGRKRAVRTIPIIPAGARTSS